MFELSSAVAYSSAVLGPSAHGSLSLFNYPKGYPVPRLGTVNDHLFTSATGLHTNLIKFHELSNYDLAATLIEVEFVGGSLSEIQEIYSSCYFEFRVCDRVLDRGPLQILPREYKVPLLISRNDTIDMRLNFQEPLDIHTPVLVRVLLYGSAKREVQ